MDPISHAAIGIAVSAAGQGKLELSNPVTIAAAVGAVIPDGDIILRIMGESLYLKHHRGVSHSLIGIGIEAAAAALVLKVFFGATPLLSLFLWTFIGALTHVTADILNSYGAKVFWPFSDKKKSLSLLTLTDPIVVMLTILSILSSFNKWGFNGYIIAVSGLYVMSKVIMRIWGYRMLRKRFGREYQIEKIHLLPSMIYGHKFQYIIEDKSHMVVGEIDFFLNRIRIIGLFKKMDIMKREYILHSKTAAFFKEFTPIFHIELKKTHNGYSALLTDLRYMLRNRFLHHATISYDENMSLIEEKFNPYTMAKNLDI